MITVGTFFIGCAQIWILAELLNAGSIFAALLKHATAGRVRYEDRVMRAGIKMFKALVINLATASPPKLPDYRIELRGKARWQPVKMPGTNLHCQ